MVHVNIPEPALAFRDCLHSLTLAFSMHHPTTGLVLSAAFLAALADSQSARLEAEISLSSDFLSATNKTSASWPEHSTHQASAASAQS
jgi:hypothetical protein